MATRSQVLGTLGVLRPNSLKYPSKLQTTPPIPKTQVRNCSFASFKASSLVKHTRLGSNRSLLSYPSSTNSSSLRETLLTGERNYHDHTCSSSCASTHSTKRPVRVRYAPSPTGSLHLGGLRTALYNYIFAKQNDGQCLLRIEDTDRTRLVEGVVDQLLRDLDWVNMSFDEGPPPLSGDCGPYTQSERLHIYRQYADQLLQNGHAYRCFCTAERLDALRANQSNKGAATTYDRLCMSLTPEEVAEKLARGESNVVRMRIPEGVTTVQDMVRGEVVFQNKLIDDQVLMKSDGFPTYHLANIVDDHLMRVTHVIRGEEWLPSSVKHVLLYQMFGWEAPQFAHLPLLLREDGSKLSKRFRDSSLDYYIEQGYLPEAIVNFVALLGWHPTDAQVRALLRGDSVEEVVTTDAAEIAAADVDVSLDADAAALRAALADGKKKKKGKKEEKAEAKAAGAGDAASASVSEVFDIDQIVKLFDLGRVQKAGAAVEMAKLNFYQSQYWKRALEQDIKRLAAIVTEPTLALVLRFKAGQLTAEDAAQLGQVSYRELSVDVTEQDACYGAKTMYHTAAQKTTQVGLGMEYVPHNAIVRALRTTRDHPCRTSEFPYRAMFAWARPDLTTEAAHAMKKTLWIDETNNVDAKGKTLALSKDVLERVSAHIEKYFADKVFDDHDVAAIVANFKTYTKDQKISLKELYLPLRFALSGTTEGPGVADQMCALGKEETLNRIKYCIERS